MKVDVVKRGWHGYHLAPYLHICCLSGGGVGGGGGGEEGVEEEKEKEKEKERQTFLLCHTLLIV